MIRKQVYLGIEEERKVKALARIRRCSEAEVIRDAIQRLPDPRADAATLLEAAGFMGWQFRGRPLSFDELRQAEAELDEWAQGREPCIDLAGAIDLDRQEHDDSLP
jgi:hypothetical protein